MGNCQLEKLMEVSGCLTCQMTESELEGIIRDPCKMETVNMCLRDIVYGELLYNRHLYRLDNNISTFNNSSNNKITNSFNNNFNHLHILIINILLILVQLLELHQRDRKTKTSVSFHDQNLFLYLQQLPKPIIFGFL